MTEKRENGEPRHIYLFIFLLIWCQPRNNRARHFRYAMNACRCGSDASRSNKEDEMNLQLCLQSIQYTHTPKVREQCGYLQLFFRGVFWTQQA